MPSFSLKRKSSSDVDAVGSIDEQHITIVSAPADGDDDAGDDADWAEHSEPLRLSKRDAHRSHQSGDVSRASTTSTTEMSVSSASDYQSSRRESNLRGSILMRNVSQRPVRMLSINANRLREYSHERLDFSRIRLVGRSEEMKTLNQMLDRHVSEYAQMPSASSTSGRDAPTERPMPKLARSQSRRHESRRSLALLAGLSGSGKSMLAHQLQPEAVRRKLFFVSVKSSLQQLSVSTKFENNQNDQQPLESVRSAISKLCFSIAQLQHDTASASIPCPAASKSREQLRQFRKDQYKRLKTAISRGLGRTALAVLSKQVPNLVDIVGTKHRPHMNPESGRGEGTFSDSCSIGSFSTISDLHHAERSTLDYGKQADQLRFAIIRFFQIVTSITPIVWIADDLQWADKASMEVIEKCLLDGRVSSLMVVATYRSNEISHTLKTALDKLEATHHERSLHLARINVDDFSADNVKELLIQLLDPKSPRMVDQLASTIYEKTHGNVFFIQHFIRMLVDNDLLNYNIGLTKWSWNDDNVRKRSSATNNVLDLLTDKLQHSEEAHIVLPLMACLGNTTTVDMIRRAVEGFSEHSGHSDWFRNMFGQSPLDVAKELSMILDTCQKEGFILQSSQQYNVVSTASPSNSGEDEKNAAGDNDSGAINQRREASNQAIARNLNANPNASTNANANANTSVDTDINTGVDTGMDAGTEKSVSFVHDKVLEAALNLVPSDKLPELRFRIGEIFVESLDDEDLRDSIFVIANLINSRLDLLPAHVGSRCHPLRFRVSQLNYQAGCDSVACASFRIAADYFKHAIELLPNDHWVGEYTMYSVRLYTAAAECASVNSDLRLLEEYAQPVQDADCPLADKMRVYHVLLGTGRRIAKPGDVSFEPIALGLETLRKLGCRLPKSKAMQKFATITGLIGLSSKVKNKWSPAVLEKLEITTDKEARAIMVTLDTLGDVCYMMQPDLMPLMILENVHQSFKRGLTTWSPPALAYSGLIINWFLGNVKAATAYAEHAMKLLEEMDCRDAESRTMVTAYLGVFHWTRPFAICRPELMKTYEIGMSTGDVDAAGWAIFQFHYIGVYTGSNLRQMEEGCLLYTQVMDDHGMVRQREVFRMLQQVILNLLGRSPHTTMLKGEAFDEDVSLPKYKEDGQDLLVLGTGSNKLQLAMYFGELQLCADLSLTSFPIIMKNAPGQPVIVYATLAAALSCSYAAGKHSKKHKTYKQYKAIAKKSRGNLEKWTREGCPNTDHLLEMVNGERFGWKGKTGVAYAHFKECIRLSGRRGQLNIQALANERLAEMWLRNGEHDDASYHFDEALRLYGEWGAPAKVRILRKRLEATGMLQVDAYD